jgi:hypothetical protein
MLPVRSTMRSRDRRTGSIIEATLPPLRADAARDLARYMPRYASRRRARARSRVDDRSASAYATKVACAAIDHEKFAPTA